MGKGLLDLQEPKKYQEEKAKIWYYPDPENVEIPPQMTKFLHDSLKAICFSFVHEI